MDARWSLTGLTNKVNGVSRFFDLWPSLKPPTERKTTPLKLWNPWPNDLINGEHLPPKHSLSPTSPRNRAVYTLMRTSQRRALCVCLERREKVWEWKRASVFERGKRTVRETEWERDCAREYECESKTHTVTDPDLDDVTPLSFSGGRSQ